MKEFLVERIKNTDNKPSKLAYTDIRWPSLKGFLPNTAGIYLWFDKNQTLIYVGKSKKLNARIVNSRTQDMAKNKIDSQFVVVRCFEFPDFNDDELLYIETKLLFQYIKIFDELPILNKEAKRRVIGQNKNQLDHYLDSFKLMPFWKF